VVELEQMGGLGLGVTSVLFLLGTACKKPSDLEVSYSGSRRSPSSIAIQRPRQVGLPMSSAW